MSVQISMDMSGTCVSCCLYVYFDIYTCMYMPMCTCVISVFTYVSLCPHVSLCALRSPCVPAHVCRMSLCTCVSTTICVHGVGNAELRSWVVLKGKVHGLELRGKEVKVGSVERAWGFLPAASLLCEWAPRSVLRQVSGEEQRAK